MIKKGVIYQLKWGNCLILQFLGYGTDKKTGISKNGSFLVFLTRFYNLVVHFNKTTIFTTEYNH